MIGSNSETGREPSIWTADACAGADCGGDIFSLEVRRVCFIPPEVTLAKRDVWELDCRAAVFRSCSLIVSAIVLIYLTQHTE